jgi:hypothetical protein
VRGRLPQAIEELLHGTDIYFVLADATRKATCRIRLYADAIELYELRRDHANTPRSVRLDSEGLHIVTANGMGLTYIEDKDHWSVLWTLDDASFDGIEALCVLLRLYSLIVPTDKQRGQRGRALENPFEVLMTAANCESIKAGLSDVSQIPLAPSKAHREAAMRRHPEIASLYDGDDASFKKRIQRNAKDDPRPRKTRLAFRSLAGNSTSTQRH